MSPLYQAWPRHLQQRRSSRDRQTPGQRDIFPCPHLDCPFPKPLPASVSLSPLLSAGPALQHDRTPDHAGEAQPSLVTPAAPRRGRCPLGRERSGSRSAWRLSGSALAGTSLQCQCGPWQGGGRVQQGPPAGAGHCPPWPGPAPAPAGSGGLVLRLDRKTNEFHYGIAILFHVSGSLRLTCSPGCDRPRHPRAALQRGAPHTCRARSCRGPAMPTLIPAGALQHLGGGKDQGRGSGTATVLSHVLKVLRPPKDSSRRQARAKHDPSRALGGHVLPKHRLGGREGVGHGGLGTLTIADGTGDLTRPMGCS